MPGPTILGYHDVLPEISAPHHVTLSTFRRHMERLAEQDVAVCKLETVLVGLDAATEGHRRRVAITFDDARDNFLATALPVLEDLGLPCALFVPTALLGAPGHLSADGVREARDRGVEIGAHGRSHIRLAGCSVAQLHDETAGSRADLEAILERPVTTFAYPFGSLDDAAVRAVSRAGFRHALTTAAGPNRAGTDPLRLFRSWPDETMSLPWFSVMVLGGDDFFHRGGLTRLGSARRRSGR